MSRFTDARWSIAPLGGRNWELTDDLVWEVGEVGSGVEVRVPAGTETDLASIPRPLWWLLAPSGQPQVIAAVAHDFLYRHPRRRPPELSSKRLVDREFRIMMEAVGTPWLRRWAMWAAVRVAWTAGVDW